MYNGRNNTSLSSHAGVIHAENGAEIHCYGQSSFVNNSAGRYGGETECVTGTGVGASVMRSLLTGVILYPSDKESYTIPSITSQTNGCGSEVSNSPSAWCLSNLGTSAVSTYLFCVSRDPSPWTDGYYIFADETISDPGLNDIHIYSFGVA